MKKQKLYYVVNARIPTGKAHGIQIMKTCEALSRAGMGVELVVPKRHNQIKKDPFTYYGVEKIFSIQFLPVIDVIRFNIPLSFKFLSLMFGIIASLYLWSKKGIVYVRGEVVIPISFFLSGRLKLLFESHIDKKISKYYKRTFLRVDGVAVITHHHKKKLLNETKISEEKILIVPDAVDIDLFDNGVSKIDARKKLNLSLNKKLIVYTGSDIKWKGLKILEEASNYLGNDTEVILVGNINKKEKYKLCNYIGIRPHHEMPYWLKAANVLVLTGTEESHLSKYHTSPLKMFEYMASCRPIVASDLPSFREVLDESNSILVEVGNPEKMAEGIKKVLNNQELSQRIVKKARNVVNNFSWQKRAEKIINFVND